MRERTFIPMNEKRKLKVQLPRQRFFGSKRVETAVDVRSKREKRMRLDAAQMKHLLRLVAVNNKISSRRDLRPFSKVETRYGC